MNTVTSQDDFGRSLKGSASRDEFKFWHKNNLPTRHWACDLDFVLIDKRDGKAGIVAVIDFKQWIADEAKRDGISFTEAGMFSDFLDFGCRVFIVWGVDPSQPPFWIQEVLSADPIPDPPFVYQSPMLEVKTAQDFDEWENAIRKEWRAK
jgi:hypothetical protein